MCSMTFLQVDRCSNEPFSTYCARVIAYFTNWYCVYCVFYRSSFWNIACIAHFTNWLRIILHILHTLRCIILCCVVYFTTSLCESTLKPFNNLSTARPRVLAKFKLKPSKICSAENSKIQTVDWQINEQINTEVKLHFEKTNYKTKRISQKKSFNCSAA